MIITREQWNHIADRSSAPILKDVLDSLNRGVKVTVKDAGQSPFMEFTRRDQFEAEYRKKLRSKRE
jgi:hypothetical protein